MTTDTTTFITAISFPTPRTGRPPHPTFTCTAQKPISVPTTLVSTLAAALISTAPVHAVAPPTPLSLTPPAQTSIIDLEKVLTKGETQRLLQILSSLNTNTGLDVHILTQNLTTGNYPGRTIAQLIPQTPQTVLIVVDVSGGNILNFRLGDRVKELIPGRWWIELANRYGNKFYVEENGMDNSIQAAIAKIDTCAQRAISSGGKSLCAVVPGVTQDQFYVGVATASVAGAVVGAAARTNGSTFNFPYVLLFSPLWSIFLISFAVAPIATRQESPLSLELVGVLLAFTAIAAAVWAWIPARFGAPGKQPPDV